MKIIGIISGFEGTNQAIENSFCDFFERQDYMFTHFLYDKLDEYDYGQFDMLLCSSQYIAKEVRKYLQKDIPVIPADRIVDMGSISKLLSIRSGTTIYVVGSNKKGAREVIDLLHMVGVNHLNAIPYDEQYPLTNKDIVVTIAPCPKRIKENYAKVVNIKYDELQIYTLLEIFIELKMSYKNLMPILKKYISHDASINRHINITNQNLQGILEMISDGILCVDKNGTTVYCNVAFSNLLDLDYFELISKSYENIQFSNEIANIMKKAGDVPYELIHYNNKQLVVNKQILPNNSKGFILSIQDVSRIQALETKVRKKLLNKGFVAKYTFDDIVGNSQIIKSKIEEAKKLSQNDYAILIQGNNGTGKEMFAQAIHNESKRAQNPFVAVNLASLADNLVESELFGYEEGAFTGALKGGKPGLFEIAHNGTIFIDEIGDVSPQMQKRLLRVLQEKEIMRIGGNRIIPIDVRIISATNKDLYEMVRKNEFRDDLYYRLKVLHIHLPDLKDRKEDIQLFLEHFLTLLNSRKSFAPTAVEVLRKYSWPGNVRELENLIYYLETLCDHEVIVQEDIPKEYKVNAPVKDQCRDEFFSIMRSWNAQYQKECCEILKILSEHQTNLGKFNIQKLLEITPIYLSVEQVRNRLVKLKASGLIDTGKTRQGSKITPKGEMFLQFMRE